MGITLNYTTVEAAESKDNWSTVEDGADLADSSYPPKEGSQCIEWDIAPNKTGGVRNKNAVSGFSITTYEAGAWILNPVVDNDGIDIIANAADGIFLRLYSNSYYADFYQPQHRNLDGTWKGGWLYLKASGGPGAEDRNGGTWGTAQTSNITHIAVMVHSGSGDSTDKNSGKIGTDWSKYYNKITATGGTSSTPLTLKDVLDTDKDKDSGGGVWGIVSNASDFYNLSAGLQIGDGSTTTYFDIKNEYLLLNQTSQDKKSHFYIKNGANVHIGNKDSGTKDYANSGSNITSNGKSDFTIDSGANVGLYDSKIQGFNNITLNSSVDIIKCDFYDNTHVYFNNTGLSLKNSRMYFDDSNRGNVGTVQANPSTVDNIKIFQTNDGLNIQSNSLLINKYNASYNTYDICVADGNSITLLNSSFDENKLKRV